MKKQAMVVMNPTAGKGAGKNTLFAVADGLCRGGYDAVVMITQRANHARDLMIERSSDFDIVICIGGDGTLNESVSGLMALHDRTPLGYIPTGTVNDFASTLHLSHNGEEAIQDIVDGTLFPCDIGSFNERYFTYVAAFGAFTEVSYTTSQSSKNLLGRVAYYLEGLKHLPKIKTYHVKIEYDEELIEDEFIFGAISNSRFIGGNTFYSTKHAQLDDGRFECLLIRPPQNPLDLQAIAAALLKQELNDKFMIFFTAESIKITSEEEIAWTLDGENGGIMKAVTIKNCPHAIDFIIAKEHNE
jgi:diacylglycerol kinase (ATP)